MNMFNGMVFIVKPDSSIEEVNYRELVDKSVEMTTTPQGIGSKFHVREATWFKVGSSFFEDEMEAMESVASDSGESNVKPNIEYVTRYEGWTWGHQGNFPKLIKVFDTELDATNWYYKLAEIDFQNDSSANMIFESREKAEAWIKQSSEEGMSPN